MKRVFGKIEAIFDIFYLISALVLGFILVLSSSGNSARVLAGAMAFILAFGDAFHLVPRIIVILTGREEDMRKALGLGKQVTSITMTVFYLLLWQIGLLVFSPRDIGIWSYMIYTLTAVRIFLCLLPQNRWIDRYPPIKWAIMRNTPFFLQGVIVISLFFLHRNSWPGIRMVWLAIALSFAFYIPVILWVNKNPKIGMLMLPKTCAYLWIIAMCLSL